MSINHISKEDHPVLKEIQRVKQYINKIKDCSDCVQNQDNDRRKSKLDQNAAKRLVKGNLNKDEQMVEEKYNSKIEPETNGIESIKVQKKVK